MIFSFLPNLNYNYLYLEKVQMVTCNTFTSTIQSINNTHNKFITDQRNQCMYDVTLRCVHAISPRLSQQPDNISYKEGNFMATSCRRQQ